MEASEYDTNHLDSDALLPPRKRLLAGLKRQSSESPSQSSLENSNSPSLTEYEFRLQNLLRSYKNGPLMSPEEIAKAAGSAAVDAAKAAEAARAAAEEKAVIAAKAVAAAKNALSLVASFSRQSKKNKMKKHVPVENLYKEQDTVENFGTDEELARKLHRAINSSPRISKHSPKNKHKKPKHSIECENDGVPNGLQEDTDSEGSYVVYSESDQVEEIQKERVFESSDGIHSNGRKRGRVKQKKMSLSVCSFKDRANPKDGLNQNSSDESNIRVPIEPGPTWKCQDLKVPQCIKSNKAVQS